MYRAQSTNLLMGEEKKPGDLPDLVTPGAPTGHHAQVQVDVLRLHVIAAS